MSLTSGTRLGPYEILAPLGAGGMGEVYRAKDTRLERTVALKVLPEEFFEDSERVARFEREAKLLAALNHPNIAAIYSFEESGGRYILVMELVAGETLREHLGAGRLPVRATIDIAAQIARGLAAAHEKGIVHRDLKPENVVLSKDGRVKLLDFGLAKLSPRAGSEGDITSAGTRSLLTEAGAVFGTVGYMSPEQVRGEPADAGSDIFSLGTILYELLAGKNPFRAATSAETMTAILRHEPPPLSEPPLAVAPALSQIVARCLDKRPEKRFQSVADLAFSFEALSGPSPSLVAGSLGRVASGWWRWAAVVAAVVAIALAAMALLRMGAPREPPAQAIRFSVVPPANGAFAYWLEASFLALSPDGSRLAYVAWDRAGDLNGLRPRVFATGGRHVWLRPLSALEARPLAGTQDASSVFWSPDGHSIAFFAEGKLKRLDLPTGSPVTICNVPAGVGRSGSWGRGGDILFASVQGEAIYRVSASGGAPVAALKSDPSRGEMRVAWPWFLPDGERFLYLLRLRESWNLMLAEPGKPARAL
ncbi:MAG TPA: serine/threonine-protein kinase, partial [Thermoanaerobaculia bacterium]|nr:serine/threonine-protein kinase [Thermoanaerobaculia bacterium]